MSKVLLVTGATGKQGGAVIDALIEQKSDFTILAVTRNAESASAKRLASKSSNIKLVQGDLDDAAALLKKAGEVASLQPIWGVYSVQISMGRGVTVESEVRQGTTLIDESIQAGVKHFVYSSVERGGNEASWDTPTPIPHFQSKYQIERYLRDATAQGTAGEGMAWTILRPVGFMDNLAPGMPTKLFLTALRDSMQGKKQQWVATADIGHFAALAFNNPEEWKNKAVGLAGDELTFDELSQAFEKTTGYPAPTSYSFLGSTLKYMVTELSTMIDWFSTDGYKADIDSLHKVHPGLLNVENWLVKKSPFQTKQ